MISKLENVLTYNAKLYKKRVNESKPPRFSCFSACERRLPAPRAAGVNASLGAAALSSTAVSQDARSVNVSTSNVSQQGARLFVTSLFPKSQRYKKPTESSMLSS